jgi:hypothetical protein
MTKIHIYLGGNSEKIGDFWRLENRWINNIQMYFCKYSEGRCCAGLVTFCVETAFYNRLLKER